VPLDKWNLTDQACDFAFIGEQHRFRDPRHTGHHTGPRHVAETKAKERADTRIQPKEYRAGVEQHPDLNLVYATLADLDRCLITKLKSDPTAVLLIDTHNAHGMAEQRRPSSIDGA
jgi:(E)-4-hydroxy-3-methylbut-2-enyl-diphosphate synthase